MRRFLYVSVNTRFNYKRSYRRREINKTHYSYKVRNYYFFFFLKLKNEILNATKFGPDRVTCRLSHVSAILVSFTFVCEHEHSTARAYRIRPHSYAFAEFSACIGFPLLFILYSITHYSVFDIFNKA